MNTPGGENPAKRTYLYAIDDYIPASSSPSRLFSTMPDLHSLPEGTWPENAVRNNGPDNLLLERAKLRELAEGWPCYR